LAKSLEDLGQQLRRDAEFLAIRFVDGTSLRRGRDIIIASARKSARLVKCGSIVCDPRSAGAAGQDPQRLQTEADRQPERPKGGYVLTRRPSDISVGEVVRALEARSAS